MCVQVKESAHVTEEKSNNGYECVFLLCLVNSVCACTSLCVCVCCLCVWGGGGRGCS